MSNSLVSIVVPLFNKEDFIERTLDSVVNQDYENLEIIIIDDSSTDGSLIRASNFLHKYSNRFARVVIETRPNTGQAGARNSGIEKSIGTFVAFLDADDIWHPTKISQQVKLLESREDLDVVFCNYFMFSTSLFTTKAVSLVPIEKKIESWLLTTGYGGLLESTGLARRSALVDQGGFDPGLQMCGGLDLAYRFARNNRAGCVSKYLCGYRVTVGGWHNNKEDLVNSYHQLFEKRSIYGKFENRGRANLKIHLDLWSLRNHKDFNQSFQSLRNLSRKPILTAQYLAMTLLRVVVAQLKGLVFWQQARLFLEKAS